MLERVGNLSKRGSARAPKSSVRTFGGVPGAVATAGETPNLMPWASKRTLKSDQAGTRRQPGLSPVGNRPASFRPPLSARVDFARHTGKHRYRDIATAAARDRKCPVGPRGFGKAHCDGATGRDRAPCLGRRKAARARGVNADMVLCDDEIIAILFGTDLLDLSDAFRAGRARVDRPDVRG